MIFGTHYKLERKSVGLALAIMVVASIGGLDPASIDRDPVAQLDGLVDIAVRRGVGLDLHVHDGGELGGFTYDLLLDRVRRAGLQGRITVSHGFALGEHGRVDKQTAYEESLRLPMLVRYPPLAKPGTVVQDMVLSLDLAPSIRVSRPGRNSKAVNPDFRTH